jgi:hypothetical protein
MKKLTLMLFLLISFSSCEDIGILINGEEEPNPITDITSGLIAKYSFDDNDLGKDFSDNNNDGIVSNVNQSQDRIANNKVAVFNGNDSYIEIDAFKNIILDGLSISSWIYIEDWTSNCGGNWAPVLSKSTTGNLGKFDLTLGTEVGFEFAYMDYRWFSLFEFKLDTWYYITVTYEDDVAIQYINGKKICNITDLSPPRIQGEPLRLGQHNSGCVKNLNGMLDEMRIYNRPLESHEVEQLYLFELKGEEIWKPVETGVGVTLFEKEPDEGLGHPYFVQEIDLNVANIYFVQANDSIASNANPSPIFGGKYLTRSGLGNFWDEQNITPNLFSISNAAAFRTSNSHNHELTFPLKVNNTLISTGYGNTEVSSSSGEIWKRKVLKIYSNYAVIEDYTNTSNSYNDVVASLNNVPNAIVGFKYTEEFGTVIRPRTYFGLSDKDCDGLNETLLILSTKSHRVEDAANILLKEFHSVDIVRLDGNTQMVCNDTEYVEYYVSDAIPSVIIVREGN